MDDSDGDNEEGEKAPTHTFDDDSEDHTADPQQVLSFVGAAEPPCRNGNEVVKAQSQCKTVKEQNLAK